MIDVRGWLWFGIRLFIYSTILFIIFIGLICIFAIWYYWFVVRRRSRNKQEINTKLHNRSFVFHSLSFQISNSGIIVLNVRLSDLEKQPIELAQLNGRKYQISSFDIHDEHVDIIFAKSNIHLTIKHEYIEQQRLENPIFKIKIIFTF
jgi:ABC-type bacteriocin/lantibiotic exporter with double-glycine peptidase domain